jgi:hypothetical protein
VVEEALRGGEVGEVELDDDLPVVVHGLSDPVSEDAGGRSCLGEPVERRLPGGEVGDGVLDVERPVPTP